MVFDWGTSDAPLKQAPLVHSSDKENEIEIFPHIENPEEVVAETVVTGEDDEKEEIATEEVPVTIAEEETLKEEALKEEQSKDELKEWNPNGTDKE